MTERAAWNGCRLPEGDGGHYESWFQRGNHPSEPVGFWIRYTIFRPAGRPEAAIGELWAILFDGTTGRIDAVKEEHPLDGCSFARHGLDVQIGGALLTPSSVKGQASQGDVNLRWDLRYSSPQPPLLFLPRRYYRLGFPKAKALVGSPGAIWSGCVQVGDREISVDGWIGSQNHNWGSKHTDRYAWGQVAGFDGHPESFLELSTAQVQVGPLRTPWMTLMVLRHEDREHRLNGLLRATRAEGHYRFFRWDFRSHDRDGVEIEGVIEAPADRFVGLRYGDPPGGSKTCLNSKIARCELRLWRPNHEPVELLSEHRAAFEILTDRSDHGVPLLPAP